MLPKYFKNLHLMVSAITGTPRIVSIDRSKTSMSDKYKDIPKEEWECALISYFNMFQEDTRQLYVLDNWSFVLGGNPKDKETLIEMLEGAIKEVKELED